MEKIYDDKLLYATEHLTCLHYLKAINTGFFYREYKQGSVVLDESHMSKNCMVFVLKGTIKVQSDKYPVKIVNNGELFLVARSSCTVCECLSDAVIVTMAFEELHSNCDKLVFESLSVLRDDIDYNLDTLPIHKPLDIFLELLTFYIRNGANCAHLHEMKQNELFLCLRYFYTKKELAHLLYPLLAPNMDFKHFVLSNSDKVKNIKELIELSNMSKTVFYETFKEEFGMTAKQWMVKQFSYKIQYAAAKPGVSVKELSNDLGFNSVPQFQQFCKRFLFCTPSELIERHKKMNQAN